ncbi:MAG: TetR family transcriptional regulator C-terminal domain-containing protein [Gemmatimonadaceae bacterium]
MSDRRKQIIEAATVLVGRQGYQNTSIDEVIREAKLCGKGHFYHYFKSKEELGYAVLARQFERFTERGLAILSDPMVEPLERLTHFIDAVVKSHAERGCAEGCPFGNLAAEMADEHEGFRKRIEAVFERWSAQIQALLREARPQLEDGVDIARLARFIIATLEGALMMSRVTREISVMEGIAEDLKRFVATHMRDRALVSRSS